MSLFSGFAQSIDELTLEEFQDYAAVFVIYHGETSTLLTEIISDAENVEAELEQIRNRITTGSNDKFDFIGFKTQ